MILKRVLSSSRVQINHLYFCNRIHQKAHNINYANSAQKPDLSRAVSEAEKIVGYPSSFLSLRWLLSDEIANVALHLRKLVGCNHPLLKTAKNLIYDGKSNMQAWGLIVLLVSKSAGLNIETTELDHDKSAGLLHSQRALAEVTEMIRTSQLIHQGLVNLQNMGDSGNELSSESDMMFGNKIALLGGDYLLGNACLQLAGLRNQELIELISSAVRDLAESNFLGDRDDQNNPLPYDPFQQKQINFNYIQSDYEIGITDNNDDYLLDYCEREWSYRNTLSSASLLGKSCQGALKLAGHSETLQRNGYLFGRHLALAWQAGMDLDSFQNEFSQKTNFSLVCAPILFHLEHDPTLYYEISKGKSNIENVDLSKIHEIVVNGPGIEKTQQLQQKHIQSAMKSINTFPMSEAKTALQNITNAMEFY